ncbi:hypothetical protein [Bradyrhizobium sp. USDA 10063]
MFDTLMARIPQKWKPVLRKNARDADVQAGNEGSTSRTDGAGAPPMSAGAHTPLPARSGGPDMVDGGTDAIDIVSTAIFGKPEMPDLRASEAETSLNNARLHLNNC